MNANWRGVLRSQFRAAMEMLGNAISACPDELWTERMLSERSPDAEFSQYWYVAFHVLFFLDYYLSESLEVFIPPAPFGMEELDPAGKLPPRVYSKTELQTYLAYCKNKCQTRLDTLADEFGQQRCRTDWHDMTVAELLLVTLRHVQEHAAQLNLFLGQQTGAGTRWVTRVRI